MAQVVAHFIGNEEVGGSSPLVSFRSILKAGSYEPAFFLLKYLLFN